MKGRNMPLKPQQAALLDAIAASTDDPEMLDKIAELLAQDYSPRIMPFGTVRGRKRMNKNTRILKAALHEKASRANDGTSGLYRPRRYDWDGSKYNPVNQGVGVGAAYDDTDDDQSDPLRSEIGRTGTYGDQDFFDDLVDSMPRAIQPQQLPTQNGSVDWKRLGLP